MSHRTALPIKVAVASAAALPAFYAAVVMVMHWAPLPFWDEWFVPGEQIAAWCRGELTVGDLFRQHNEHRRVIPSLVNLTAVGVTGRWDVRDMAALAFAFVCLGAGGLYLLLRRTVAAPRARVFAFIAMSLFLFSPRQYENFIFGSLLGEVFVASFALVAAALVNLSAISFRAKALVNAAFAAVSTYTFGGGMLLWIFGFPLQFRANGNGEARWIWRAVYVCLGAIAIGCYFIGYQHPPLAPAPASPLSQAGGMITFLLVWLGNVFLTPTPIAVGAAILACFVALSATAMISVIRGGDATPHYPWLALGWFVIVAGLVAARARLGFGYDAAYHVRYVTSTVFLYISAAGLAASLYGQIANRASLARVARGTIVSLCVAALALWLWTFRQAQPLFVQAAQHRQHLAHVLRWSVAIPNNPDLALFSPYPSTPETIRTLADHDALRPRLVSRALSAAVSRPPHDGQDSTGVLERVEFDPATSQLHYSGWMAATRDASSTGMYVVVGFTAADGAWRLLGVAQPAPEPDPRAADNRRARFARTLYGPELPAGPLIFRAWAADARTDSAAPLAGAVEVVAHSHSAR